LELSDSFRGAALVAKGPAIVLEAYRGLADARDETMTNAATRFQLCSVSKQFAAACILLLAKEGSLSVDDPVAKWFPVGPPSWKSISIANLMTHTAGLGHWPDYAAIDPAQSIDDDDFVAAVRARPLPTELPAPHFYSSPGYGLLARVIERASGLTYARFVTEYIFGPLKMRGTFVGNGNDRDAIARGYRGADELPSWELDCASKGAGDIWTTARDLDRWDRALLSDALLPIASRELMFRPHAPIDGLPNVAGYGFGWLIGEIHDQPLYVHTGDNPGYMSFNAIVPSAEARVILLTNDETTDIYTPAMQLLEAAVS
jgi:CubicO group peptidase (beta-lactamase class C family)